MKDNNIEVRAGIKRLIENNSEYQTKRLNFQLTNIMRRTNVMLERIKIDDDYISNHEISVRTMLNRINDALDNSKQITSEEIDNDALEQIQNLEKELESNYRTLSLRYYSYYFNILERKNNILSGKLDESLKQLELLKKEQESFTEQKEEFEKSVKKTNSKLEGLGATFINIVLTISITSSLITVLEKAEKIIDAFTIVIGCAWLLLSSIIFVSEYFKSDTIKNKKLMVIYWILTLIFLLLFCKIYI